MDSGWVAGGGVLRILGAGVSDVCCERQVKADSMARICSILISFAVSLAFKSVIACSMVDVQYIHCPWLTGMSWSNVGY